MIGGGGTVLGRRWRRIFVRDHGRIARDNLGAFLLLSFVIANVPSFALARQHSADPLDWIIQHVCANPKGEVISADPYDRCPEGTQERRLGIGDLMPYLRHDQPGVAGDHPNGYQRHDAYPMADRRIGGIVSANDFDFGYRVPYGRVEPGDGDGYDVYRVVDGWVTGGDTRDGAGYSQSFFGTSCKPFGGWVFFPVKFLQSLNENGESIVPIMGSYWEQNGEPWPGKCNAASTFSKNTLTTWEFVKSYPFGGFNGAREKSIDTIVSTHGFPASAEAATRINLERFYFTDLYGLTRWEAWSTAIAPQSVGGTCSGANQLTYRGVQFRRLDCRDWSLVKLLDPPEPRPPWPYPHSNLLKNYHFDEGTLAPWGLDPAKPRGLGNIELSLVRSFDKRDTEYSRNGIGVRYLDLSCGADVCAADQAVFQDVPLAGLEPVTRFDYGVSVAVDGNGSGTLKVSLTLLDRSYREIWRTHFVVDIPRTYTSQQGGSSVYRSASVHLTTSPPLEVASEATILRFSMSPRSLTKLKILDTWLMPRQ